MFQPAPIFSKLVVVFVGWRKKLRSTSNDQEKVTHISSKFNVMRVTLSPRMLSGFFAAARITTGMYVV